MEAEHVSTFRKFTFTMLGISSLIGWNAILTTLSFFIKKFEGVSNDVGFLFPIPYMSSQFLFGLIMPYISEKVELTKRIVGGLIILSVLMVSLPVVALLAPNKTGFYICMGGVLVLLGATNSLSQNSQIGLAAKVGGACQGIYWSATALSGLSTNFIMYILTLSFGSGSDSNSIGIIVFYSFAAVANATTIFCFLSEQQKQVDIRAQQPMIADGNQPMVRDNENYQSVQSSEDGEEESMEKLTFIQSIVKGAKSAGAVPLLIFLIYIQTFMMFPGVSATMHSWHNAKFGRDYGILTLITLFNAGDYIGKVICSFPKTFNFQSSTISIMFRFIFFATFILGVNIKLKSEFLKSDAFVCIEMLLFGTLNGYGTSSMMAIGPSRTSSPKRKELIGFIDGFSLQTGIFVGTLLSLIFEHCDKW